MTEFVVFNCDQVRQRGFVDILVENLVPKVESGEIYDLVDNPVWDGLWLLLWYSTWLNPQWIGPADYFPLLLPPPPPQTSQVFTC